MIADEEGEQRHQHQRPGTRAVAIEDEQKNGERRSPCIEDVPARELLCLAIDLAGQLAEGNHRAGEGDSSDEDAEEHLDLHDRQFHRRLVRQKCSKPGQRRA